MDIRAQFHRDEYDRVLFFTAPPLDVPFVPLAKKTLGHSVKYLAKKARDAEAAKNSSVNSAAFATNSKTNTDGSLGMKRKSSGEADEKEDEMQVLKRRALEVFSKQIDKGTEGLYKRMFGDEWETVMKAEGARLEHMQEAAKLKEESMQRKEALRLAESHVKLS